MIKKLDVEKQSSDNKQLNADLADTVSEEFNENSFSEDHTPQTVTRQRSQHTQLERPSRISSQFREGSSLNKDGSSMHKDVIFSLSKSSHRSQRMKEGPDFYDVSKSSECELSMTVQDFPDADRTEQSNVENSAQRSNTEGP